MQLSVRTCLIITDCPDVFWISLVTAAYVEFVNLTTFMKETSGKNVIKIRRRGNLQGQTNVECKLKGGSAKGGIDITIKDGSIDFLAPLSQPPPDRAVTFEPGDNQTGKFLVL